MAEETIGRWQMSVGSKVPFVKETMEEWHRTQRILSEAGYKGMTRYQTRQEARTAAEEMLANLDAIDSTVEWRAVCFFMHSADRGLPRHPDEGKCFLIRHESADAD